MRAPASTWRARWKTISLAAAQTPRRGTAPPRRNGVEQCETGFGFGLNFLVTWAAWRADLQRPTLLHFVSTEAWPVSAGDLLRATSVHPELAPLAEALHRQWWGLLPGVHRLRFDEGRVLLTLYVGDTQAMLRQQNLTVDSIYLDGFSPQRNPESWDLHTLKAVARSCRRGT